MKRIITVCTTIAFLISLSAVTFAKGNPNPGFPRTYNPKGITVTLPYTFVNTTKVEKGHNSNPKAERKNK